MMMRTRVPFLRRVRARARPVGPAPTWGDSQCALLWIVEGLTMRIGSIEFSDIARNSGAGAIAGATSPPTLDI